MRAILIGTCLIVSLHAFSQQKKVCITIDDLPAVTNGISGHEVWEEITSGIVSTLTAYDAHAIGYVNEGKLYREGKLDPKRVALLEKWLKNGQELGNHTYSHPSYHRVSYQDFTRNIVQGTKIIKPLAEKHNTEIKYFRHPYLHIGLDKGKADSLKTYLKQQGYIESPVTIDNDDYLFAAAYSRAYRKDDKELMEQIATDYLVYMEEKLVFFEAISVELYERAINQTLLIHANLLNAHYLDELLDIYRKHDYQFVSQEEILLDKAYDQEVNFFGNYGISWIKRWALSAGKEYSIFKNDPKVPEYIR